MAPSGDLGLKLSCSDERCVRIHADVAMERAVLGPGIIPVPITVGLTTEKAPGYPTYVVSTDIAFSPYIFEQAAAVDRYKTPCTMRRAWPLVAPVGLLDAAIPDLAQEPRTVAPIRRADRGAARRRHWEASADRFARCMARLQSSDRRP
jgi:hypothetical protein